MDLEAESTKIKVDTSMAKDIAVKCNELIDLQNEIKTIEEKLNKVKEQEKFLSEHALIFFWMKVWELHKFFVCFKLAMGKTRRPISVWEGFHKCRHTKFPPPYIMLK